MISKTFWTRCSNQQSTRAKLPRRLYVQKIMENGRCRSDTDRALSFVMKTWVNNLVGPRFFEEIATIIDNNCSPGCHINFICTKYDEFVKSVF